MESFRVPGSLDRELGTPETFARGVRGCPQDLCSSLPWGFIPKERPGVLSVSAPPEVSLRVEGRLYPHQNF